MPLNEATQHFLYVFFFFFSITWADAAHVIVNVEGTATEEGFKEVNGCVWVNLQKDKAQSLRAPDLTQSSQAHLYNVDWI